MVICLPRYIEALWRGTSDLNYLRGRSAKAKVSKSHNANFHSPRAYRLYPELLPLLQYADDYFYFFLPAVPFQPLCVPAFLVRQRDFSSPRNLLRGAYEFSNELQTTPREKSSIRNSMSRLLANKLLYVTAFEVIRKLRVQEHKSRTSQRAEN